jgi:hypothetical protein
MGVKDQALRWHFAHRKGSRLSHNAVGSLSGSEGNSRVSADAETLDLWVMGSDPDLNASDRQTAQLSEPGDLWFRRAQRTRFRTRALCLHPFPLSIRATPKSNLYEGIIAHGNQD